jgi:hypothetical protein
LPSGSRNPAPWQTPESHNSLTCRRLQPASPSPWRRRGRAKRSFQWQRRELVVVGLRRHRERHVAGLVLDPVLPRRVRVPLEAQNLSVEVGSPSPCPSPGRGCSTRCTSITERVPPASERTRNPHALPAEQGGRIGEVGGPSRTLAQAGFLLAWAERPGQHETPRPPPQENMGVGAGAA